MPIASTVTPQTCPIQALKCKKNQQKVIRLENGCEKLFCECIPPEQCPPINHNVTTAIGFELEEVSDGCCAILNKICRKENCPAPPKCPDFYITQPRQPLPEECCPNYECVPPEKCIVEITHTNSPLGGEVLKSPANQKKTLKEVRN